MMGGGWTFTVAAPGWWLVRRCLWSGEASVEPVAGWASRGDGEVRPVAVGERADRLTGGIRPTDPRAPDVEAVIFDPGRLERLEREENEARKRYERERSRWT